MDGVGERVLLFALAAISSTAIVKTITRVAARTGLLDHPNARSSHAVPTPRGGGVGIVVTTLVAATLFWRTPAGFQPGWPVFAAAGAIGIVGLIDDLRGLPALLRLTLHLIIAYLTVVFCGAGDGLGDSGHHIVALAASALWIASMVNAYNFMDGIDGLAGGMAVIMAMVLTIIAAGARCTGAALVALALAGAASGFAVVNWAPATVFMGDVGSGFLGFVFGAWPLLLLNSCGGAAAFDGFVAVAGTLSPFIYDTASTIVRRALLRENLMVAHRSHLYQRMVRAGLSHSQVSGVYLVLALNGAVMAAGATMSSLPIGVGLAESLLAFAAIWWWTRALEKSSARMGAQCRK